MALERDQETDGISTGRPNFYVEGCHAIKPDLIIPHINAQT